MINISITDYSALIAFWLAFTRWAAVLFQLPLFDNLAVPGLVKVLVCVTLTYVFFPTVAPQIQMDIAHIGLDRFWILTLFYSMVGLVIGYFVKSIMTLITSSGNLITQQVGFAALRYFDPGSSQELGPFEKLLSWAMLIMILTTGALLPMFKGVYGSFFSIHIYDLGRFAQSPVFFIEMFKSLFVSSIMLATPLIFANMFIMAVMGVVSRMVPQMNIIMVSFVVTIGIGMLVFISSSDEYFQVAYKLYVDQLGEWFNFIR